MLVQGMVIRSDADPPPYGWAICDGSAISRTAYAKLFAMIGTIYGGDDTTFAVPNWPGHIMYLGAPDAPEISIEEPKARVRAADDFDTIRSRLAEIRQGAAAAAQEAQKASGGHRTCGQGSPTYCGLCGAETLEESKVKCHSGCMC